MRSFYASIVLALSLTCSAANATWVVTAESPSATGWAKSEDLVLAKRRALKECAIRTPNTQACIITNWYWE